MASRKITNEMPDSAEKREMCFHCIYPECINCLGGKHEQETEMSRLKTKEELATVEKMWWDGYPDRAIAAAIDRSVNRVYQLRKDLGLEPCNPPGLRFGV